MTEITMSDEETLTASFSSELNLIDLSYEWEAEEGKEHHDQKLTSDNLCQQEGKSNFAETESVERIANSDGDQPPCGTSSESKSDDGGGQTENTNPRAESYCVLGGLLTTVMNKEQPSVTRCESDDDRSTGAGGNRGNSNPSSCFEVGSNVCRDKKRKIDWDESSGSKCVDDGEVNTSATSDCQVRNKVNAKQSLDCEEKVQERDESEKSDIPSSAQSSEDCQDVSKDVTHIVASANIEKRREPCQEPEVVFTGPSNNAIISATENGENGERVELKNTVNSFDQPSCGRGKRKRKKCCIMGQSKAQLGQSSPKKSKTAESDVIRSRGKLPLQASVAHLKLDDILFGSHLTICEKECSYKHHPLTLCLGITRHTSKRHKRALRVSIITCFWNAIENGWDRDSPVPDECPAFRVPVIHLACMFGRAQEVKVFLEMGLRPFVLCCTIGGTAIHTAQQYLYEAHCCEDNDTKFERFKECLRLVINVDPRVLLIKDRLGRSVFHTTAMCMKELSSKAKKLRMDSSSSFSRFMDGSGQVVQNDLQERLHSLLQERDLQEKLFRILMETFYQLCTQKRLGKKESIDVLNSENGKGETVIEMLEEEEYLRKDMEGNEVVGVGYGSSGEEEKVCLAEQPLEIPNNSTASAGSGAKTMVSTGNGISEEDKKDCVTVQLFEISNNSNASPVSEVNAMEEAIASEECVETSVVDQSVTEVCDQACVEHTHTFLCAQDCIAKHNPLVLLLENSPEAGDFNESLKRACPRDFDVTCHVVPDTLTVCQLPLVHLACMFRNENFLRFLLNERKCDPRLYCQLSKQTPLMLLTDVMVLYLSLGIRGYRFEHFQGTVDVLIEKDSTVLFTRIDRSRETIFHYVAKKLFNYDGDNSVKQFYAMFLNHLCGEVHSLYQSSRVTYQTIVDLINSPDSNGDTLAKLLQIDLLYGEMSTNSLESFADYNPFPELLQSSLGTTRRDQGSGNSISEDGTVENRHATGSVLETQSTLATKRKRGLTEREGAKKKFDGGDYNARETESPLDHPTVFHVKQEPEESELSLSCVVEDVARRQPSSSADHINQTNRNDWSRLPKIPNQLCTRSKHTPLCAKECSYDHHPIVLALCGTTTTYIASRFTDLVERRVLIFLEYLKEIGWCPSDVVPDDSRDLQFPLVYLAAMFGRWKALLLLSRQGYDPSIYCFHAQMSILHAMLTYFYLGAHDICSESGAVKIELFRKTLESISLVTPLREIFKMVDSVGDSPFHTAVKLMSLFNITRRNFQVNALYELGRTLHHECLTNSVTNEISTILAHKNFVGETCISLLGSDADINEKILGLESQKRKSLGTTVTSTSSRVVADTVSRLTATKALHTLTSSKKNQENAATQTTWRKSGFSPGRTSSKQPVTSTSSASQGACSTESRPLASSFSEQSPLVIDSDSSSHRPSASGLSLEGGSIAESGIPDQVIVNTCALLDSPSVYPNAGDCVTVNISHVALRPVTPIASVHPIHLSVSSYLSSSAVVSSDTHAASQGIQLSSSAREKILDVIKEDSMSHLKEVSERIRVLDRQWQTEKARQAALAVLLSTKEDAVTFLKHQLCKSRESIENMNKEKEELAAEEDKLKKKLSLITSTTAEKVFAVGTVGK